MQAETYELIDKSVMYALLTKHKTIDTTERDETIGHPLDVEINEVADMDDYYIHVKKMQQFYNYMHRENEAVIEYYKPCYEKIDEAYEQCNIGEFKKGLESLVLSIFWE